MLTVRKNRPFVFTALLLFMLIGMALAVIPVRSSPQADPSLQVFYINVGQGDSILIHDSSGFDVLIDGGKTSAGQTVLAFLRSKAIDDIDVMLVTHADADHVGGLIDVLEASDIPVEQVLYNGYPGDTTTWNNFATAVTAEGLTLTAAQFPQVYTWGLATAHILNPASGLGDPETNDASVVVLLEHGSNRYLFTGDIDSAIEATIVARQTPVAADVLKVPHHGSAYGSSAAFLSAVQPDDAVISVGVNSYGHPDPDTLNRLASAGAIIWRTDQNGSITVFDDGAVYTVYPEYGADTGYDLHLPLILRSLPPTPTPTPTATLIATDPVPSSTPTPTPTPTATTAAPGNVLITTIFYDGNGSQEPDEYVEIRNDGGQAVQLQNWTLRDIANHVYTFPAYLMQPGQTCRVYTNEVHPEWCNFNYGSGVAIWNNTGDCAYVRDMNSSPIDEYCYP